jgi:phenylalanyl-tRNA synthetase beta chain
MRTSLLPGLIETLRTNVNRKMPRVRIFEVGRTFQHHNAGTDQPLRVGGLAFGPRVPEQWGEQPSRDVDFFDVKGDVEALAAPRRVATSRIVIPALHPGRAARVVSTGLTPAGSANCTLGSCGNSTCRSPRSCSRSTSTS